MPRREFHFEEGSSAKFWAIELNGKDFTVNWGRMGTAGQSQTKSFSTEADAAKQHDKLVHEKTSKGYVEITAAVGTTAAPTASAGAPAPCEAPSTEPSAAEPVKPVPKKRKKGPLELADITVAEGPRQLATKEEIDFAESQLGAPFPKGYREFVTTLGGGTFKGGHLNILLPRQILANLEKWRERIDNYWLWDDIGNEMDEDAPDIDEGASISKRSAMRGYMIGDTNGGHELVVDIRRPDWIFVLPHEEENSILAGSGLLEAVEYICNSKDLSGERVKERVFSPFQNVAPFVATPIKPATSAAPSNPESNKDAPPAATPQEALLAFMRDMNAFELRAWEIFEAARAESRQNNNTSGPLMAVSRAFTQEGLNAIYARHCSAKAKVDPYASIGSPPAYQLDKETIIAVRQTNRNTTEIETYCTRTFKLNHRYRLKLENGAWKVAEKFVEDHGHDKRPEPFNPNVKFKKRPLYSS